MDKAGFGHKTALMWLAACSCWAGTAAQNGSWHIEAESPATRVLLRNDTLDITSPQGLSLWWSEPVEAPCRIEYRACVVVEDGPCDRLSDLNCFWMASEGGGEASPLRGRASRGGRFAESYRLRCYYMGFGGNHNTTTRFRRYDGDSLAVHDENRRPDILEEYTDEAHLLRPNHWYDVCLEVQPDARGARIRYTIDGETLVDYADPLPLWRGWFAFRTTWSHTRLTAFHISGKQTVGQPLP